MTAKLYCQTTVLALALALYGCGDREAPPVFTSAQQSARPATDDGTRSNPIATNPSPVGEMSPSTTPSVPTVQKNPGQGFYASASAFDETTGEAKASGSVQPTDSLGSAVKTLMRAVGVSTSEIDESINSGKTIPAAVKI